MGYRKMLSLGAAIASTAGGVFLMSSPAAAKSPILVTAPDAGEVVTRRISYADLNLASAAGEQSLNHRVHSGVLGLCDAPSAGPYSSAEARCRDSAWEQARPQIAQAVQRAREIALTGTSTLAAVAITVSVPQ